jgi:hypothetical protein
MELDGMFEAIPALTADDPGLRFCHEDRWT